jgi:hypothetical protein
VGYALRVHNCVSADLGFGQIGKELGARWRALSDAEKKEYS